MPSGLYKPHTPRPDPNRDRIRVFPVDERRFDRKSIIIGLIGTVLFHLLFFYGIPPSYLEMKQEVEDQQPTEFDIQLADEEKPVEQPKFVETNQAAPDNVPDETDNFSARNQQAANPEPPKELSPDQTPAREGEEDVPFDKVFSGDLNPPEPTTPPTPQQQAATPQEAQPSSPQRQDPLSGFEEDRGETEGTGSSVADESKNPQPVDKPIEGEDNESRDKALPAFVSPLSAEHPTPQPRPRLPRALPGPVKAQPLGVSQTGAIGVNAKFSQYGEYLERMVEAVSQRWTALCASRSYGESNARVTLEFKLTREGLIKDMETVDSTSKPLGVILAMSAVTEGQSYGVWPKDMVDVLGDEQTVTFTFHYW